MHQNIPDSLQDVDINVIPREILIHVLASMCSYQRSKVCSVSKFFEFAAISASKNQSSHKLYYEDPSTFHDLIKSQSTMLLCPLTTELVQKRASMLEKFKDVVFQIVRDRDYHLLARLKCEYVTAYIQFAAKCGYVPVVDLMLKYHPEQEKAVYDAFCGACEGGNLDLSKCMLGKLKICFERNINNLYQVSEDRETEDYEYNQKIKDWRYMFYSAGVGGNVDIFTMLRTEFEFLGFSNYGNWIFAGACAGGRAHFVKWVLDQDPKIDDAEIVEGFGEACSNGHLHIMELLMSDILRIEAHNRLNIAHEYHDLGYEIYSACAGGHAKIFDYLKGSGLTLNWNEILQFACQSEKDSIIDLAIKNGADGDQCDHCHGLCH